MFNSLPRKRVLTERRAPTHRRLVDAATKVVARRGFHAATVDEIAAEAGFSVGALYSNFAGKDDLFLAVFDGHVRWFRERLEAAMAASDTRAAVDAWMDGLTEDPEQLLIFIEFWAYAVRKPKLRRRFAALMAQFRSEMAEALASRAQTAGRELPLPPDTLALVLLALGRGLAIEQLADPQAVGDDAADVVAGLVP
jgi:AcrR family transcriptional regulator